MGYGKKLWWASFVLSLSAFVLAAWVFMYSLKSSENTAPAADETKTPTVTDNEQPENTDTEVQITETDTYTEPQDNVGSVSFTEDQMTEISRKIFSVDGFLNNFALELDDGKITVSAKIKDKDKILKLYPELKKYGMALSIIENKKLTATASIAEKDGRAAVSIDKVTVAGLPIDGKIIEPFIGSDDFAALFDVSYESINIDDGMVIFTDEIPEILQY